MVAYWVPCSTSIYSYGRNSKINRLSLLFADDSSPAVLPRVRIKLPYSIVVYMPRLWNLSPKLYISKYLAYQTVTAELWTRRVKCIFLTNTWRYKYTQSLDMSVLAICHLFLWYSANACKAGQIAGFLFVTVNREVLAPLCLGPTVNMQWRNCQL